MAAPPSPYRIRDLPPDERESAVPVLKDGFTGIYRWHAKRKLHEVATVRAAVAGDRIAGVAILERLVPEAGYVYYLAVAATDRRRGVGALLLDDAIARFRADGAEVVYAAAEDDNTASIALFATRGFRTVERDEPGFREGGLGAWGLRSRMMVVHGEVLMGLRLRASGPGAAARPASG